MIHDPFKGQSAELNIRQNIDDASPDRYLLCAWKYGEAESTSHSPYLRIIEDCGTRAAFHRGLQYVVRAHAGEWWAAHAFSPSERG